MYLLKGVVFLALVAAASFLFYRNVLRWYRLTQVVALSPDGETIASLHYPRTDRQVVLYLWNSEGKIEIWYLDERSQKTIWISFFEALRHTLF